MKIKTPLLFILVSIVSLAWAPINAKILVMTHCFNQPEFIPWQYACLKKFLKDEYTFMVFNDAPNQTLFDQTVATCKALDIPCMTVPQCIHHSAYLSREDGVAGPSAECSETIQFMMNQVGFNHPGIVVVLDSDMFLVRDLSIEAFMHEYDIVAHPGYKENNGQAVTYLLPNLIFFNIPALRDIRTLNFNLGTINGVRTDSAGYTFYYLEAHPEVRWLKYNVTALPIPLSDEISFPTEVRSNEALLKMILNQEFDHEFYFDLKFLHFRCGSNWNEREAVWFKNKKQFLFQSLSHLLKTTKN